MRRFVGGQDDVGLLAGDGGMLVGLDNDGVGDEGGESVDVDSKFQLNQVSLLDVGGVFREGRVVSADLVDGDGGGEGQTLECVLLVDLVQLLVDLVVSPQAEFEDLASH